MNFGLAMLGGAALGMVVGVAFDAIMVGMAAGAMIGVCYALFLAPAISRKPPTASDAED